VPPPCPMDSVPLVVSTRPISQKITILVSTEPYNNAYHYQLK